MEDDLDVGDVVRADLTDETIYGFVADLDGDRVLVAESGLGGGVWCDRWRVQSY